MIHAELHDKTGKKIVELWMAEAPAVGSLIWITGAQRVPVFDQYGSGSFIVEAVAHWVNPDWSPSTHAGEPIHRLCIYVKPLAEAA
ncbi:hypothetical protein MPL3356_60631 [Mesorhizobium plurifarium]|uniref:Uncharacterized protein n=1 Tax=Mesorhizobium plurifarium TaxID=69974 RepID=A0A090EFL4_MESPL|nr:hypothetical protein MPL3356_60631 [Mesorhizobium plurifarium]